MCKHPYQAKKRSWGSKNPSFSSYKWSDIVCFHVNLNHFSVYDSWFCIRIQIKFQDNLFRVVAALEDVLEKKTASCSRPTEMPCSRVFSPLRSPAQLTVLPSARYGSWRLWAELETVKGRRTCCEASLSAWSRKPSSSPVRLPRPPRPDTNYLGT